MRISWRAALGGLAGLVAAVAWAVASAVHMPMMQPAGVWIGDDGVAYPNIASNNTYWPREVRHLAILLAFAGVVLLCGAAVRGILVGAAASAGWLVADVLLDRSDVSGTGAAVALGVAAAALFAATAATAVRLSRDQARGPVTRHVVAGTAALLAVAALTVVTPWDAPGTPAEISVELQLNIIKTVFAVLFAAVAAAVPGRPAANPGIAAGFALVAVAGGAVAAIGGQGPAWGYAMLAAFIGAIVAVAAPRVRSTGGLAVLVGLSVFGAFAAVAVLYIGGMVVGGVLTSLAGNPPVNAADTDHSLAFGALAVGVLSALFTLAVTAAAPPSRTPAEPVAAR